MTRALIYEHLMKRQSHPTFCNGAWTLFIGTDRSKEEFDELEAPIVKRIGFVTRRVTGSWPIVLNEQRNERRSNFSPRSRNSSHVSQILQSPLTNPASTVGFSCFARSSTEFRLFHRTWFFSFFLFFFEFRKIASIPKFKQNDVPLNDRRGEKKWVSLNKKEAKGNWHKSKFRSGTNDDPDIAMNRASFPIRLSSYVEFPVRALIRLDYVFVLALISPREGKTFVKIAFRREHCFKSHSLERNVGQKKKKKKSSKINFRWRCREMLLQRSFV